MMEDQQQFECTEDMFLSEFTEAQVEQLMRLRNFHIEKAQKQMLEERHRLEFARWLVVHGRLTDELPIKRRKGFHPHHLYRENGESQSRWGQ